MRFIQTLLIISLIVLLSHEAYCIDKDGEKKEKSKFVLIETVYGEMKVLLYNETPLHRDNFIKLVKNGFYDSLLFHRVIKDFMIQGGDPDSKGAAPNVELGNGGPGYDIDAEFVPGLYHKKGAIASARESDNVNPEKKSSGSQFYIVQGRMFTPDQLDKMEQKINEPQKQKLVYEYVSSPENNEVKMKLDSLNRTKSYDAFNIEIEAILKALEPKMKALDLLHYTDEQRLDYSTKGGTPHLDRNYTVFGEIIEGLNIIDSIASVKTGKNDRPLEDVIMKMKIVRK